MHHIEIRQNIKGETSCHDYDEHMAHSWSKNEHEGSSFVKDCSS